MRQFGYNLAEFLVIEKLEEDESDKILLVHLLNVIGRGNKCAYFGKPYGEGGDLGERCLAPEIKRTECNCPFYNRNFSGNCVYEPNRAEYLKVIK
ncbi:hypothetical protein HYU23_00610 [Candidatus Woesearchaeota archaeon]|nr:hypothetical protein [Candidatus Woesearchaeota archaeon]